jgi:hypothetical protein
MIKTIGIGWVLTNRTASLCHIETLIFDKSTSLPPQIMANANTIFPSPVEACHNLFNKIADGFRFGTA